MSTIAAVGNARTMMGQFHTMLKAAEILLPGDLLPLREIMYQKTDQLLQLLADRVGTVLEQWEGRPLSYKLHADELNTLKTLLFNRSLTARNNGNQTIAAALNEVIETMTEGILKMSEMKPSETPLDILQVGGNYIQDLFAPDYIAPPLIPEAIVPSDIYDSIARKFRKPEQLCLFRGFHEDIYLTTPAAVQLKTGWMCSISRKIGNTERGYYLFRINGEIQQGFGYQLDPENGNWWAIHFSVPPSSAYHIIATDEDWFVKEKTFTPFDPNYEQRMVLGFLKR